jgi:adenine-specific DNA methylase
VNELDHEIGDQEICSSCGSKIDPGDGNYGYGKYTCSNGHKHDVKETLQRQDKKPEFEYFAIQYITPQGEKKIKTPDSKDLDIIEEVENKFKNKESTLPIPDQPIPEGDKTQALLNYNYEKFSELFTERQLLTYGVLFNLAQEIEDQNISEYVITALSNSLEYNSKLCKWYTRTGGYVGNVFSRHAFIPRVQPVEANPLNHEDNVAALEGFFDRALRVKEYCERPFEKLKNRKTGDVSDHYIQNEEIREDRLLDLRCKTSESITLEDESVDYIITDPPYYDNVQYSELSDYFYIWLREALKEDYEEFQPELVPKAREIVANSNAGKGEEFFIESLTNVFTEANRVLKSEGEMVFTYHHNENEAWSVILESLISSGFAITGAYPVQSEMPNNPHISDLDNAEYDILIFANKEKTNEETTLNQLRQDLFFELQDMVDEERDRHRNLSTADLGVILRGKCMYYYSRHYPEVYSEGDKVSVTEALEAVDDVIAQVLEGSVSLPQSIDPLTQAYAAFLQRGWEEYDDLNKHLLAKNLNVSDLEDEKLVKGPRDKKEPASADERIHYIESKLNKNGKGADGLLDIDKVQYLYHLYKTDQNTVEYLKEWKSDDLEDLADFMADVTDDDRYEDVMEMGLSQF